MKITDVTWSQVRFLNRELDKYSKNNKRFFYFHPNTAVLMDKNPTYDYPIGKWDLASMYR